MAFIMFNTWKNIARSRRFVVFTNSSEIQLAPAVYFNIAYTNFPFLVILPGVKSLLSIEVILASNKHPDVAV